MKNIIKSTIIILLFVFCVSFSAKANNDLIMEVVKDCGIQYGGDICEAELKVANNTGVFINGSATLYITYQGICSNNELVNFDGLGIEGWYNDLLPSKEWNGGKLIFDEIRIEEGESISNLKISTAQNLCPGKYNFELGLTGYTGISVSPISIGGSSNGMYSLQKRLDAVAQIIDTNKDNKIDIFDFNYLMVNWGKINADNIADFNSSGQVDIFDFNLLMIHWTG